MGLVGNYRRSQDFSVEGGGDGIIQCEEVWERALPLLDELGEKANWKEEGSEAKDKDGKEAIRKYQEFRRIIEKSTHPRW